MGTLASWYAILFGSLVMRYTLIGNSQYSIGYIVLGVCIIRHFELPWQRAVDFISIEVTESLT
jgi:hypothetical protein